MTEFIAIKIRCFLCRHKFNNDTKHVLVDSANCPASKKTIKEVFNYLARCSKTELHISPGESLCLDCYNQILEFDSILMTALLKQKSLALLVEKAALNTDSEYEEECYADMESLKELTDDRFFDDVAVSDSEIDEAIHEAVSGKKSKPGDELYQSSKKIGQLKFPQELKQCHFCSMRFKTKIRLHKHMSQAHKKYGCDLCNFTHRNEDYVMLHMNTHEGRKETQCRFCYKEFTTKISTIRHMEVHLNSKKYQCDKCGLCFSQTTVLYNHKLQHDAEEQPLRCEKCNQIFKTKRTFRHHMITHREDRPRYTCEFCSKTFTEKYTLKVHKRTNHNPNPAKFPRFNVVGIETEPKFNCIICNQSFANKDALNKHMEKEHDVILKSLTISNFTQYEPSTNETKKPCQICGHMFSSQPNLDCHLETVHGYAL